MWQRVPPLLLPSPSTSSDFPLFATPHVHCLTTDDLWIAGWLAAHADVPMVLVPGGWTMFDDSERGAARERSGRRVANAAERKASGSSGKWDLSSINSAAGDMACVRGVEQTVGPWREKRWQEAVH